MIWYLRYSILNPLPKQVFIQSLSSPVDRKYVYTFQKFVFLLRWTDFSSQFIFANNINKKKCEKEKKKV